MIAQVVMTNGHACTICGRCDAVVIPELSWRIQPPWDQTCEFSPEWHMYPGSQRRERHTYERSYSGHSSVYIDVETVCC